MTPQQITQALDMAKSFNRSKDAPVSKYQEFLDELRSHVRAAGGNVDDVDVVAALYFALGVMDGSSPYLAEQRVRRAADIARVVCHLTAAQITTLGQRTIH